MEFVERTAHLAFGRVCERNKVLGNFAFGKRLVNAVRSRSRVSLPQSKSKHNACGASSRWLTSP